MALYFIIPVLFLGVLSLPFVIKRKMIIGKKQAKNRIIANVLLFAVMVPATVGLAVNGFSMIAKADETTTAEVSAEAGAETEGATNAMTGTNAQGLGFLAAALSTGLASLGAGIAVASGAPAAIGAISENPKSFGKAIIFVVLGEGIAIYGILVSVLIITKL